MALVIEQFLCRSDNFGVVIHDPETGLTASIDAPQEKPIRAILEVRGWQLDRIYTTHHHGDHVEANLPLKAIYGCTIIGPAAEADKIPGIDETVKGGDVLTFGSVEVSVVDTPGHTLGHVSYWFRSAGVAFVGDTLFSLGCGRVFEGTPAMMWASLLRLRTLPDETRIYCGHEYTEANARFALTIEPDNADLVARADEVKRLRAAGKPSLPTTVGLEKATNPFLRADTTGMGARLGLADANPAEIFGEIRRRKDNFQ